jgi:hypothetical protein
MSARNMTDSAGTMRDFRLDVPERFGARAERPAVVATGAKEKSGHDS